MSTQFDRRFESTIGDENVNLPRHYFTFAEAVGRTIFAREWGVHEEGFYNRGHSGKDLMDIAPPTPHSYCLLGFMYIGRLEQVNGMSLIGLIVRAMEADGLNCSCNELPDDYVRDMGYCLIMEACGEGVAWTDDHEAAGILSSNWSDGLWAYDRATSGFHEAKAK